MRAAFLIAFCQYKVKPAVVNCPSFHYRGGPESFFAFQVDCRQRDVGPHSGVPLSMSPIRGDVHYRQSAFRAVCSLETCFALLATVETRSVNISRPPRRNILAARPYVPTSLEARPRAPGGDVAHLLNKAVLFEIPQRWHIENESVTPIRKGAGIGKRQLRATGQLTL